MIVIDRDLNQNFDAVTRGDSKMKKEFSVLVNDIGGRPSKDGQMLQPIKHLSGKVKHLTKSAVMNSSKSMKTASSSPLHYHNTNFGNF